MSPPLSHADIVLLAQLFLRLSPTGLITDCTNCGGAVSMSICRTDRSSNGGKPMARHSSCSFYCWYPQLLASPHIMSLIQMSTTSPSPPSSQPITSSSSTTLAMLLPSSTQPSSKRQCKRGEQCLGSFCTCPHALHCSRDLCLRHCCEAGGCHFHGFHDGLPLHGDDDEVHDDFLIEQSEDGGFGREELRQALNASLKDLGLPIPDIPVPSIYDLISAPPAPIPRVQSPNVPFEADLSSSPVLPALPHTSSSRPMPKHPRIMQQMDPIWDNAAVKVKWVSKCPYYPQWQLADNPELVASLGADIHKIEVYDEHLQCWIPTALTHTISLESGCNVFL
ncbi:hypothetical protein EV424DRAFT_1545433 [Suillus variegatus]|nr:hypothetical protein EV424DRAFT_1545433 [Suillus variegatus]